MKTKLAIATRLSHSYRGGWAHLDRFAHAFNARSTRPVIRDRDEETQIARRFLSIAPAELLAAKQAFKRRPTDARKLTFTRWLERTVAGHFSFSGCRCEHDCCGCISGYADAHRVGRRAFSVVIRMTANY